MSVIWAIGMLAGAAIGWTFGWKFGVRRAQRDAPSELSIYVTDRLPVEPEEYVDHEPKCALSITHGNPNLAFCELCERPIKRTTSGQPWRHIA